MNRVLVPLLTSLTMLGGAPVWAHGDEKHMKTAAPMKLEQKAWGIAGQANAVTRSVDIKMLDSMRFTPDRIEVKQGDTVRLTMTNTGAVMHELVVGTQKELVEHGALMKSLPNMEHDEPYMARVAPGKTGEIIWTFNRAGEFDFACLLPGHFEAGMVGKIVVNANAGAEK